MNDPFSVVFSLNFQHNLTHWITLFSWKHFLFFTMLSGHQLTWFSSSLGGYCFTSLPVLHLPDYISLGMYLPVDTFLSLLSFLPTFTPLVSSSGPMALINIIKLINPTFKSPACPSSLKFRYLNLLTQHFNLDF